MKTPAVAVVALLLAFSAACGSQDTHDTVQQAEKPANSPTAAGQAATTTAARTAPAWTRTKTLPGAKLEPGDRYENHDLWIDRTNHVVYADDCGTAERATKPAGPYQPAPDQTGTVIAWGWTCPNG